ncbi:22905_t:CDS:2, partial [Racocetra persica]
KNAFEKDFWKLINNSIFGKTIEDENFLWSKFGKHVLKNTKVIDKWKDENGEDRAIGYAGRELTHKIFEDCVLEGKEDQPRTSQFL